MKKLLMKISITFALLASGFAYAYEIDIGNFAGTNLIFSLSGFADFDMPAGNSRLLVSTNDGTGWTLQKNGTNLASGDLNDLDGSALLSITVGNSTNVFFEYSRTQDKTFTAVRVILFLAALSVGILIFISYKLGRSI